VNSVQKFSNVNSKLIKIQNQKFIEFTGTFKTNEFRISIKDARLLPSFPLQAFKLHGFIKIGNKNQNKASR